MPTLRSVPSSPTANTTESLPNPTPGRKLPRCTKCGRPRQGHPRSGCPYSDSPMKDAEVTPTKMKAKPLQGDLSQALGSMHIEPTPTPNDREGYNRRSSRTPPMQISESLASIATDADKMLNELVKPGFFSRATDDAGEQVSSDLVVQVTDTLLPKATIKSGPKRLMPGTMIAPSWESSFGAEQTIGTVEEPVKKSSLAVQTSLNHDTDDESQASRRNGQMSTEANTLHPLQRSNTIDQRGKLFSSLSQTSPASVFIYKKQDVDEIQASAEALRLHVHVIDNMNGRDGDEETRLVIGPDLRAVEKLAEELKSSIRVKNNSITNNYFFNELKESNNQQSSPSTSTLKAMTGGAIVGAIGTWAGLAFS